MRHRKHKFQLGVKSAHREAIMASLATALFTHGRIQTTLTKAKALRPYAEKIITYAKKAALTEDAALKVHYRRLAIAKIHDVDAAKQLFTERAGEFVNRTGGYTRIYKLGNRLGDAAETALIELVKGDDKGYEKLSKKAKPPAKKKAKKAAPAAAESAAEATESPAASDAAPAPAKAKAKTKAKAKE